MRGFNFPREFYIPKGATKISDKNSDAVAYIYQGTREWPNAGTSYFGAVVFFDKANKPVINETFRKRENRNKRVADAFLSRVQHAEYVAQKRAEKVAFVHDYKVGDIFATSWGYDQTNVDFYEVTGTRGKRMLILQEISRKSQETGYLTGNCWPIPHSFVNDKEYRVMAQAGGVKIDGQRATRTNPSEAHRWSSYA